MRILHLPKWYPNRYDDQDGNFVARHVAAIGQAGLPQPSAPLQMAVVFAAVARGPLPHLIDVELDESGPAPTWRYYYRARFTGLEALDKPLKLLLWLECLRRGTRQVRRYWGAPPHLVHVHVLLRTGLWAWWLRLTQGIPYLITEHWTIYLPERTEHMGWLRQRLTRFVVGRAAALHTVSQSLRQAMQQLGATNRRPRVIANVVDTQLFRPLPVARTPRRLLVVSAFHDQVKNISGVMRVVGQLRAQWPGLHLRIAGYGPDEDRLRHLAADLGLLTDGTVAFLGKLPSEAVAREMQQATALVSFSRAETFGCVLLEARATGCPVVGPATGGVTELFHPAGTFGLLVPPDDEPALRAALTAVVDGSMQFEPAVLRTDVEQRCSYAQVGQQFTALYFEILTSPAASGASGA